MKKLLILITMIIFLPVFVFAKGFSSQITHINSAGFPRIEARLKVFNKVFEELKSDNFLVTEDNKKIDKFAVELMRQGQYIILLLDRSSSIKPAMPVVKQAAAQFAVSLIKNVSMALMSFGSDIDFNQKFTSDKKELLTAIRKIRPWGGTALYDGLYRACEEVHSKAGRNDLKTVVCLTDGRDSTPNGKTPLSIKTPKQVCDYAIKHKIRIVAVGLGNDIDVPVLKSFAKATQGWYLQAKTASQLSNLYAALSKRMKLERYYRLKYTTPNPAYDGTKRWIEITSQLKNQKDQGKGFYIAPDKPPVKILASEESDSDKNKFSYETVWHDLDIAGPDRPYLLDNIHPPHYENYFPPNGSSYASLDKDEAMNLVNHSIAQTNEFHTQQLASQHKYLDKIVEVVNKVMKSNNEKLANKKLPQWEVDRLTYRNVILEGRLAKVDLTRKELTEESDVHRQNDLNQIEYYRKEFVLEEDESSLINYENETQAKYEADKDKVKHKYKQLRNKLEAQNQQAQAAFLDNRGTVLKHSQTRVRHDYEDNEYSSTTTEESQQYEYGNETYNADHTPSDYDDEDNNDYDNDDDDFEMPEIKALD